MIVTDLDHIEQQVAFTPSMTKAIAWLRENAKKDLADGTIQIDGDNVYAMVQSYQSVIPSDPPKLEAHKKYIDVQYVVSGEEAMGWALAYRLKETMAYSAEKDVWLGTCEKADFSQARLSPGHAAILLPSDGHAPRLAAGTPMPIKKIVIKVAV